jgi:hypothetical protein
MGCSQSKDDFCERDEASQQTAGRAPSPRGSVLLLERLSRRAGSRSMLDEYRRAAARSWTRPVPVDAPRREQGSSSLPPAGVASEDGVIASPEASPNPLGPAADDEFSVVSRSASPAAEVRQQPDSPLVFSALNPLNPRSRSPPASGGDFDLHHIGDRSGNSTHLARSFDAATDDGPTACILRDALPPSAGGARSPSATSSSSVAALHEGQRRRSAAILHHRTAPHGAGEESR